MPRGIHSMVGWERAECEPHARAVACVGTLNELVGCALRAGGSGNTAEPRARLSETCRLVLLLVVARKVAEMPYQHFSARAESPTMDLVVDMGNPILNSTVNGFLKVGPVGAAHAATQEAFEMFQKESITKRDLEGMVKKAGHEGLQWGLVAGIYSGTVCFSLLACSTVSREP